MNRVDIVVNIVVTLNNELWASTAGQARGSQARGIWASRQDLMHDAAAQVRALREEGIEARLLVEHEVS